MALDVDAVAVPSQQRLDCKSMAQVMQAGSAGIRRTAQADVPGQLHERPVERSYSRSTFPDKRRALLDAWSALLAGDVAVIAEGGLSLRPTAPR